VAVIAVAAAVLVWSAARAPLPPDTDGVSGQYAVLEDVSCPVVSHCGWRVRGHRMFSSVERLRLIRQKLNPAKARARAR
jgi:hypothetical protein